MTDYIEVASLAEATQQIQERLGQLVVLHYTCHTCYDTQVTDSLFIDEDLLDRVSSPDGFTVRYACTTCGTDTLWITDDNIEAIEFLTE
jgi:hypothetical protein